MKKNQTENEYEMVNSHSCSQIYQLETLCGAGTLYNCEKNRKLGDFFSLLNKKTDFDKLPFPEENKQRSNRNQIDVNTYIQNGSDSYKKNYQQNITFRHANVNVTEFDLEKVGATIDKNDEHDNKEQTGITEIEFNNQEINHYKHSNSIENLNKYNQTNGKDRLRQRNRTIRQAMLKNLNKSTNDKVYPLSQAAITSIMKKSERSTNYGRSRVYLKYIDSIIAIAVLVNITLSIIDNEIYTNYSDKYLTNYTKYFNITHVNSTVLELISERTISAEENTLRFINSLLVCITLTMIYFHYLFKMRLYQAEDRLSKYDNIYTSGLYKYMLLEMLICCVFYPPYLNLVISGSTSEVIYANNLNSIISFVVMFKSYIIIRVYSYFSRWTSDLAKSICIKENVKAGIKFAIKSELKKRPYTVLIILMLISLSLCAFAMRTFEFGVKDPTGITKGLKGDNDLQNLFNCFWLIIVTMTTVGYGDMFPRSNLGRIVGVLACIIGMILVSMIIVSLAVITQFTNEQEKAYIKLKKFKAEDTVSEKAAEVIRVVLLMRKINLEKQKMIKVYTKSNYKILTRNFVCITQLKRTISNFKNYFKVAISHSEPLDEMLINLEEELEENAKNISVNGLKLIKADELLRILTSMQDDIRTKSSIISYRQRRLANYLIYLNNLNCEKKNEN